MDKKTIYIIRHGETEYNRMQMVQGSGIDSSLNDKGRAQGSAFFQKYQHVPFDKIYTSELRRSYESVSAFIENKIPYERLRGLNEISWGHKEGRTVNDADDQQYWDMLEGWKNGEYHLKVPGGESPLDLQERMQVLIDDIFTHESEKNILICTHGRAMRVLLCTLLRIPLSNMEGFKHANLCLYVLEYHFQNDEFTLTRTFDTEHLEGIGMLKNKW